MVATLLKLKYRLLRAGFRRTTVVFVLWLIGLAYCLVLALGLVAALAAAGPAALASPITLRVVMVLVGSFLVLAWALFPTLFFGADQTLDPARFALFPLAGRQLAPGLALAGLVGVPGLLTVVLAVLGSAALFATSGWPVVVAVLGGAAGAGLATLACRIPITFLSTSLASRRGRDIVTLVTVVLFVGGYTAYVLVATRAESVTSSRFERIVDQVAAAAQILEWTPFGVAWALGPDAVDGRWGRLGLHAALTLAYLAVGFWLFARLLDRGLTNPPTSRVSAAGLKHDAIARWAGRLPRRLGPARAVAARCWVNYRRDPRYTAVLPLIVLFPVLLTLMARLGGSGDGPVAWLGVGLPMLACGLTAFMAGYSLTNDVGSDATAWWVHLSSAVPGWADRLGRVAAQMGWCLPLVVATGVVVPVVVGQPDKAAAAVGTMLGLYLVSLGVASVSSGLVVYPIALPGESPFSTKTGNLGTQFVAQMAESLACVVVAGPVIAVGLLAPNGLGWLVIVAGLVWGAAGLAGGVVLGGRIVDRRGPAILDTLRKNDTRVRA